MVPPENTRGRRLCQKTREMKVSVAVITYNQEHTLPQTLDSILMQKGDFSLELVIGEDCSTDGTRNVVIDYQRRFPDIVKPILQPKNRGIMGNAADTFLACTGEYINMIAGDDYWIDEYKLDKQVRFLEAHPDYGLITTDGYKLLVKKNRLVPGLPPVNPVESGEVFSRFTNSFGVYAMPLTVLFRAELLRYIDFNEFERRRFSVEDTPLQAILSHHARFGYIPDKTAVYRVYEESATFISFDHPRYLDYHRGLVAIRQYLDELFPGEVAYSEEWADEYLFYREFLLYLHNLRHKDAKELIRRYSGKLSRSPKYIKSKKFASSALLFILFHFYKERSYRKAISQKI